jgi:hypothetical protein
LSAPARPALTIEYDRAGRLWFFAVLAVGAGLRAWQWLAKAPLWIDELALTNGLLSGSFTGLFDNHSDFAQVAPPGVLALEWLISRVAVGSDLALRAPSFLFSTAGVAATWFAAREFVGERDAWVAPAFVALGTHLVLMSGQVKSYGADVFFAALMVGCVLLHDRTATARSWRMLIAMGMAAPLFSFGAVFVLAGVGAFLLVRSRWQVAELRRLLLPFAAWAVATFVCVMLSRRLLSPDAHAMMNEYWKDSFPVIPPRSPADLMWPWRSVLILLWSLMGLRGVWLFGVGLVAGAVIAWRQQPARMALLLTPIATALVTAALRQYPFGPRVLHWTVPMLALLLTVLASWMAAWIRPRARMLSLLPAMGMLVTPAMTLIASPPPYWRDDIRPIIARLAEEGQPGDGLYLYWGAWHSWQRYGGNIASTLGDVYQGGCPQDYPRGFLKEVDRFRGQPRAWFLFSRVQSAEALATILRYLDTIGARRDSLIVEAPGVDYSARVDLYRYDLSDSSRLALADADRFPIAADLVRREEGCLNIDAMMRRGDGRRVVTFF